MGDETIHLVTMPKWGLAMQEGTITDWHVAEGARVNAGEPLCDIETAKITNEFESPYTGTLARVLKPGASLVQVGEIIGVVVEGVAPEAEIDALVAAHAESGEDAGGDQGPSVETVATSLGDIAMLQTGNREEERAVLFLHGFGGDHSNWGLLQSELPEEMRAIAIDLPGHGASGSQVGSGSVKDIARAVIAFLDAAGIGRVDLVGHSFGANVAAAVAAARPEAVASLAVIAPPAFGAAASADYVQGFLRAERKKEMKPVMEMLFSDPAMVSRTMVNDAIAHLRGEGVREALARVAERLLAAPASETDKDLAFLRRWPATIVWGGEDRVVPMPAGLAEMADGLLHTVEGSGHMPHAEAPEAVAAVVLEHLRRARAEA